MENNFIGILYRGSKPTENVLSALVEVLRDLLHVDAKNCIAVVLDEKDILTACAKQTTAVEVKNVRAVRVLKDIYEGLPGYIKQSEVPDFVMAAYLIHLFKTKDERSQKIWVSCIEGILQKSSALIEQTSPTYVLGLKRLLEYAKENWQKS